MHTLAMTGPHSKCHFQNHVVACGNAQAVQNIIKRVSEIVNENLKYKTK